MNQNCRKKMLAAIVLSSMLFCPMIAAAQVSWVKDFDDAQKQAAREKKFLLLDISASW